ncbi:MAG: CDP-alcohol phosphatidyltransferase family protein [Candidatus Marinimicrobia bacterium]|nr:CDP-alcohol phosphatidyltransferase family protein [Candidatus Neomarinimicrobiota bacterium]MBL7110269.1 CDP-alcohol phosphatidyltransferase family protein [Candidatus Neomarinimicrobiota bacterium]
MRVFFQNIRKNYQLSISVSNVTDFWTKQVCRRFAAVIVIIIYPTPITPNIITVFGFVINIIANYQLLSGDLIMAALLYFISYVMDCTDGQLARQRNTVTKFGMFFDPVLDGLKDLITFISFISYFSDSDIFYLSLVAMFNVSASIIFDWVRHTIQNRPKDLKPAKYNLLKRLGIVFWSVPSRNFIIVFCLLINYPAGVMYYICFPGTYFTLRKGLEIISLLKEKT